MRLTKRVRSTRLEPGVVRDLNGVGLDAAVAPNQLWETDLRFLPLHTGVAYAFFIVDAYSRTTRGARRLAHAHLGGP